MAHGSARRRSSGSSTACGSRCTAPATTSRVFTRSLNDVTDRVPEVVEAARALPVRDVVLDGEAIALRPDGRPQPVPGHERRFGGTPVDVAGPRASCRCRRTSSTCCTSTARTCSTGRGRERFDALAARACPRRCASRGWSPTTPTAAEAFLDDALAPATRA